MSSYASIPSSYENSISSFFSSKPQTCITLRKLTQFGLIRREEFEPFLGDLDNPVQYSRIELFVLLAKLQLYDPVDLPERLPQQRIEVILHAIIRPT